MHKQFLLFCSAHIVHKVSTQSSKKESRLEPKKIALLCLALSVALFNPPLTRSLILAANYASNMLKIKSQEDAHTGKEYYSTEEIKQ